MTNNEPRFENGKPLLVAELRVHFTAASWEVIPAHWQRFGFHLGKMVGRAASGLCFSLSNGCAHREQSIQSENREN